MGGLDPFSRSTLDVLIGSLFWGWLRLCGGTNSFRSSAKGPERLENIILYSFHPFKVRKCALISSFVTMCSLCSTFKRSLTYIWMWRVWGGREGSTLMQGWATVFLSGGHIPLEMICLVPQLGWGVGKWWAQSKLWKGAGSSLSDITFSVWAALPDLLCPLSSSPMFTPAKWTARSNTEPWTDHEPATLDTWPKGQGEVPVPLK